MKILAIICNILLFLFTCLVLITDGLPKATIYIFITLWTFLTLIINTAVISLIAANESRKELNIKGPIVIILAIICNIIFLAAHYWAFLDQYPHPDEEGFVAFVVLLALTPILSLVVLFRSGVSSSWLNLHIKGKAV